MNNPKKRLKSYIIQSVVLLATIMAIISTTFCVNTFAQPADEKETIQTEMAKEAGVYDHLWDPKEIGITKAKDLIDPLTKAVEDMKSRPDHYSKFNSPNGWGSYDDFFPWIEKYLNACINNPDSTISICK